MVNCKLLRWLLFYWSPIMSKIEHCLMQSHKGVKVSRLYWLMCRVMSMIICFFPIPLTRCFVMKLISPTRLSPPLVWRCVRAYSYIPLFFVKFKGDTWGSIAPKCISHNFIWPSVSVFFSCSQSLGIDYFQSVHTQRSILGVFLSLSEFDFDTIPYSRLCFLFYLSIL